MRITKRILSILLTGVLTLILTVPILVKAENLTYTCGGNNCTTISEGTMLTGSNEENFYVIDINGDTYTLMTRYLLQDKTGEGYEQSASSATGKTVAYGSNVWTNIGSETTYAGDIALAYINSIGGTPSGNNGIPYLSQICEFSGICCADGTANCIVEQNQVAGTYAGFESAGNLSSNYKYLNATNPLYNNGSWSNNLQKEKVRILLEVGNPDGTPYGYWLGSAQSSGVVWCAFVRYSIMGTCSYSDTSHMSFRPVFNISSSSIQGLNSPETGINIKQNMIISVIALGMIMGIVIINKKKKIINN